MEIDVEFLVDMAASVAEQPARLFARTRAGFGSPIQFADVFETY